MVNPNPLESIKGNNLKRITDQAANLGKQGSC